MADLEWLATVVAWDDGTGTGRFANDLFCQPQDFDRSILTGAATLAVGQRIAYRERLVASDDGGAPWRTVEVHPIAGDAAYWAGQIDELCRAVERGDTDLTVALEVASEETVEDLRDSLVAARERRDKKVPEIAAAVVARCTSTGMSELPGFDATIYARGEEQALQAVLDAVADDHLSAVLALWKPMLTTLEEIRTADEPVSDL